MTMHVCIEGNLVAAFASSAREESFVGPFQQAMESADIDSDAVEDIRMLMTLARDMGRDCDGPEEAANMGREMAAHVGDQSIEIDEWRARHARLTGVASAIQRRRNWRIRRLCEESGLSPDLVGIHPHNAAASRDNGHPWPGIDYDKVDACIHEMKHEFAMQHRVSTWDAHVRAYASALTPYEDA